MIIATNNKGKLEEIKKILKEYSLYSLKEKNIQIDVSCGDTELITLLQKIEKENINNDEIDLLERTVKNIESYFETKRKNGIFLLFFLWLSGNGGF